MHKAVRKKSWVERKEPRREGGGGRKSEGGLAPSLGLGEGWPVMGMGFGQKQRAVLDRTALWK